ncbi:MAG: maleylpyruvate isomerase family mycothiol-dependent enzyme [Chloroflexia bacterium]|nr:maleylpyruvate isomerase family mycothiol-dependent enzyme [Chloroflexia bacterium]
MSPGVTGNARVDKLLNQLDAAWMEFQESYAGLTDEQILVPGVTGAWSVRDLIAHVTWWEEEAIAHLPLILDGGRAPRYSVKYGGIDAFNALMTERTRGRSLAEVRREFAETHRRLVSYILSVPPEHLVAEPRFRRRLKLDTFGHYPIHTADIRAWRSQHGR